MDLDAWSDLFVAGAGAGAALAGLIIVAMSVNIEKILAIPSMTSRAAVTIAVLVLIVAVTCEGLIPDQAPWVLGLEVVLTAVPVLLLALRSSTQMVRLRPEQESARSALARSGLGFFPSAGTLVAGLLLCADLKSGLYVIAAVIVVGFATAVTNAWVLLVEILR